MPTFVLISRHSPENCPMFNEKARKVVLELAGKMDRLEETRSQDAWVMECPNRTPSRRCV